MKIQMNLGESRRIFLEAYSCTGAPFIVDSADYALERCGSVEVCGECDVRGREISFLLTPAARSFEYVLSVTFRVGVDVVIRKFRVEVI